LRQADFDEIVSPVRVKPVSGDDQMERVSPGIGMNRLLSHSAEHTPMLAKPKLITTLVLAAPTLLGVAVVGLGGVQRASAQVCSWEQKFPDLGRSPDNGHAMAYDSARGVTVLFGGYDGANDGETWEWNGATWTLRATSGPSPRFEHSLAYDSARGVTVLFGGFNSSSGSNFGDTWEWDGTTWTLRATGGPSPRAGHALAYDSARGVTVLFGGNEDPIGPFVLNGETWEWDGATWTLRATSGPSPRTDHALAYDSARGVSVLFGGGWRQRLPQRNLGMGRSGVDAARRHGAVAA